MYQNQDNNTWESQPDYSSPQPDSYSGGLPQNQTTSQPSQGGWQSPAAPQNPPAGYTNDPWLQQRQPVNQPSQASSPSFQTPQSNNTYARPSLAAPNIAEVDAKIRSTPQGPGSFQQQRSERLTKPQTKQTGGENSKGRGKRGALWLAICLGAVLLAGGGVAAYFIITTPEEQTAKQENQPADSSSQPGTTSTSSATSEEAQALFIAMLSKAMDVNTVTKTVTMKHEAESGAVALSKIFEVQSNVASVNQPASNAKLSINQQVGGGFTVKADYIAHPQGNFLRFKEASSQSPETQSLQKAVQGLAGKWLQMNESAEARQLFSQLLFTNNEELTAFNRVASELIIGNVNEKAQQKALTFAFLQQVYTIQSFEADSVGGDKAVRYEVVVKTDKLAEYAKAAGVKNGPTAPDNTTKHMTVYIAAGTGLPRRITTIRDGVDVQVDYGSYNGQITVTPPANVTPIGR